MASSAHIVATEARCAVGLTASSAAAAVRAGISRIIEHPLFEDEDGERVLCAWDPGIDPAIVGVDRIARLSELALGQIAKKLSGLNAWPADVSVLLAFPEVRPGFGADAAAQIARRHSTGGVPETRSMRFGHVGDGHAGALSALRAAVSVVSTGQQDVVIVGGVDSYCDAATLAWLDGQRRLARSGIRSGFPPGEGAAFMAVASERICDRLGLESLARVRSVACTQETRDPLSDVGPLGEALGKAVLEAVRDLNPPEEVITDAYGDLNGELARNHDWGFAVLRAARYFRDASDYVSPVSECGDVGAATGALGCVLATEAWKSRRAKGPRALLWAGSWNGLRAAAVLEHAAV